jgi:hypothetical protein
MKIGVAALSVLLAAIALGANGCWNGYGCKSFEQTAWLHHGGAPGDAESAARGYHQCYRGRFVCDLRANRLRRGMTKAAVEKLLGKPSLRSARGCASGLTYILGYCDYWIFPAMDASSLDICFDRNDGLIETKVTQH